jgi:hypothetical protein
LAKRKKKAEKPPREFTRRQLSQWQRQNRRQRITFWGGVFIIAAIILLVLVGWYIGEYRPLHQTAIRVNDAEFDMGYYIDTLKLAGREQSIEYLQSVADRVVIEIEQNELVRQGAWQLGISISDDEVKEALEGSDVPVNDASLDAFRRELLRNRLYDEYFSFQVPESDKQVHMMAMLLESGSEASEVRTSLQNSENFTALAEELSLDPYTKNEKGDLGWHPEGIITELLGSSVPGDYALGSEVGTLSQPRYDEEKSKGVGYWLIRVLEKQYEDDAQVQAVLLGSEEEAKDVRARLEAGEDLATLAEELSQDDESKKQGGELGVVSKGELSPAVDEYIFNPEVEIGVWSEVIRDDTVSTKGAYWLIKVLDKDEDRQLEHEDRDFLLNEAFTEWVSLLWVDPSTMVDDSYLDSEMKQWAIEQAMED